MTASDYQALEKRFTEIVPQGDTDVKKYSERRPTAPSLRETLLAMEPTSDMTATEKELLAKYKKLVADYRELESQVEAQRTLAQAAERLQARLEEVTRMLKDAQQTGDIMDEEALEEELTFSRIIMDKRFHS